MTSAARSVGKAEPAVKLCDLLPWAALVAPGVVLQKDGLLQQSYRVQGPDWLASSMRERSYGAAGVSRVLQRLGSGWSVFVEARRRRTRAYLEADWRDEAGWLVDVERAQHLQEVPHYQSEVFLTLAWMPDGGESLSTQIERFKRAVASVMDLLSAQFESVERCDDAETLAYLHSTISTRNRRPAVPEVPNYLDAFLADQPLTVKPVPKLGETFMQSWTVVGFPGSDYPGRLDALALAELDFRWMTRFIGIDRGKAGHLLGLYERRWKLNALLPGGTGVAFQKEAETNVARAELERDALAYGYCTSTVVLYGRSPAELERKSAQLLKLLDGCGYAAVSSATNAREAWLGSLPGNVFANIRRPIISTRNLAHMLPLGALWQGQQDNRHLRSQTRCAEAPDGVGLPLIQCTTSGATPFYLNLNPDDVGHTLVVGPTGSGKSTLLSMLALQWRKYPGARVAFFDMHLSARAATLAMGGRVFEPGREGTPAYQPLSRLETEDDRSWCADFVELLFDVQSVPVSPEVREHIAGVVRVLGGMPPEQRTMSELCRQLESYDLSYGQVLAPYCQGGKYGSIFDGCAQSMTPDDWSLFEMSHLMSRGPGATAPGVVCTLRLLERMFDGRPMLVLMDEAWRLVSDSSFASKLQEYLRTLRKKNVFIVFASQQIEDAAECAVGATIADSCMTQIFLADPKALDSPARVRSYQTFGLTKAHMAQLTGLVRKREYALRTTEDGAVRFRAFSLGLGPVQLALAGMSNQRDQQFMDRMVQEREPADYLEAILERRNVRWAIDALREQRRSQALEAGQ